MSRWKKSKVQPNPKLREVVDVVTQVRDALQVHLGELEQELEGLKVQEAELKEQETGAT
jgi:hypothetical protein